MMEKLFEVIAENWFLCKVRFPIFRKNTTPITEVKISLHWPKSSLNGEMETQEDSSSAFSPVKYDSKNPQ